MDLYWQSVFFYDRLFLQGLFFSDFNIKLIACIIIVMLFFCFVMSGGVSK